MALTEHWGRSAHLVEGTSRQIQAETDRRPSPQETERHGPPPFSVAISRQAGLNGRVIGEAVARRLGWPIYGKELLQQIATEMGVDTDEVESFDERRRNWLEESLGTLLPQSFLSHPRYVHHLARAIFALAARGGAVFVGRGAAQILPAASTLRIYLAAPRGDRVRIAMKRFNYSEKEADEWVTRIDKERREFLRDYFHRDPNELSNYDMVINPLRLGEEGCATVIADALGAMKKA
jgi:cytidylate kinase